MNDLCFIDTETTSLRHDRRAWEIAVIRRSPGEPDLEQEWFVELHDLDLGNADLMSLKIGRYHERHPQARDIERYSLPPAEADVMRMVEEATRGCHLIGAVPSFDAEVLGNRMRANGICPSWHYHLIDVEALAAGYLRADTQRELTAVTALPWNSDALSRAIGVDPDDFDRHTALGDARWARAIYDKITAAA